MATSASLPGVRHGWPGQVFKAEILRKFGSPVCHVPFSPSLEFFLVLLFGCCQVCLSKKMRQSFFSLLLGGDAAAFRLVFFVSPSFLSAVGFHIYKLISFECAQFKLFLNLWRQGGPDHLSEYQRWQAEEAAKWTTVSQHSFPPPLTSVNTIPIRGRHHDRHAGSNSSNTHRVHWSRQSVFSHLNFDAKVLAHQLYLINVAKPTILEKQLGPPPSYAKCLAHDHSKAQCRNQLCCKTCLRFGHILGTIISRLDWCALARNVQERILSSFDMWDRARATAFCFLWGFV